MEPTPLYMLFLSSVFCCRPSQVLTIPYEATQTAVSLRISPSRSQFFKYESVSLSCEDQGSSAGGRVRRNTTKRWLEECPADWGVATTGSPCSIQDTFPHDSGVYWCESGSGEHSPSVNITVHEQGVILESPVFPVIEGQAVTLRCLYKDKEATKPSSNFTAAFYKDGSLVRTEAAGEMNIPAVSTSDAGLYKCSNSELGGSPESWLAVRAPPPAPAPLLSLPRLLCSILVTCPYLVVTALLLEMCCRSRGETTRQSRRVCPGGTFNGEEEL
ncbi:Fc receptor-like protein 5 isoform X2 [Hypomesus transpacificus]|uniref:Fc receptor-like protein 5 isoform X2 n=1 Tax=Hypomesus transpacificus TaxID=137520 RepID=UPI001F074F52|nr:Fc receptor-like protein 5 isoform X2 [Hypomesus transpacificus]